MSEPTTSTGLPKTVTRDQVREACRMLGVDPKHVAGLQFYPAAVVAQVYAVNENGGRYALHRPDGVDRTERAHLAMDQVCIPIVEGLAEQDQAEA
jgi:hypothetical protein